MTGYRTLVDVDVLASHLDDPDWVVLDCRFALGDPALGPRLYVQSRIRGAAYAHLEHDLSAPTGPSTGRHPLPDPVVLAQTFARWRIGPATQVVVYDDSFGSIAVRLWWLLNWMGHRQVALLDGGWPRWKKRGLPIDNGPPSLRAPAQQAAWHGGPDDGMLADAAFVDRVRTEPEWMLLDARPDERYTGEHEPIDRVPGHIPGSRNRTFEDNIDYDGRMIDAATLRADFLATLHGIPPERVVHTCGSGVTACHNLLAMQHAGLSGGRLYVGSWSEWITDANRPIAQGTD